MITKFQVGLKSLLRQGPSEPELYGYLVYILKKIFFSAQSINIISHYKKKLAKTLVYCKILHAWWSIKSRLASLLFSLIARWWVGLQTLWRFRLKDLPIDEMVGAWCFGCCQAHTGLPFGSLLLRYSVLFTIESLSLLYLFFIFWLICSRRWCIDK